MIKNNGCVEIIKTNENNITEKLSGAIFTLTHIPTNQSSILTTDINGFASLTDLPLGEYTLEETTPPEGFHKNETIHRFTLTSDVQMITFDYKNKPLEKELTIIKSDATDSGLLL